MCPTLKKGMSRREIARGAGLPAGIARYGVGNAGDVLKHALHAPEAPSGKDRDLLRRIPRGFIQDGRGQQAFSLRVRRARRQKDEAEPGQTDGGDGGLGDAVHDGLLCATG